MKHQAERMYAVNNADYGLFYISCSYYKSKAKYDYPKIPMDFHILKAVRDKYNFDASLFTITGNLIMAQFHEVRKFVHRVNAKRDLINYPERALRASQINAMGLIDEILHYVIYLYRTQENPNVLSLAFSFLEKELGAQEVKQCLMDFSKDFPPLEVYQEKMAMEDYYSGSTEGIPNKELILEEMLNLWLANSNPAFGPYREFFDDNGLQNNPDYIKIIDCLKIFFEKQKPFGPQKQNLIDMLRSPAILRPHSLREQLIWIRENWGMLLGKFFFRLLSSLDFITEEEKMRGFGPGKMSAYDFSYENEYERFSMDKEWMPKVVLMAKSTLVWLDQLSKQYKRSITRLDQIPDQELDRLASWGFTGLWLIGLWERSSASKQIKIDCGNPDAEASAYSLYDYTIAGELGGFESLNNLRERCWKRGIRLASDMVPNHTGIHSKWVVEHPDWFVQLDYPPFPGYTFNGRNYCEQPGVGVFIEDHYFSKTDASVVFKRVDFNSGETRYIYHGNDGTHMPWNDTAQLNFLLPEVREAVIKTIIHVAKNFPIIRFDAAMTLAKKHYQRLWFPEPGSGGDIPSRAEHGMSKMDFNKVFPLEFWREVVDRVAKEAPDTLLLAEAFWLMEGYFVRTLGMHRVYNSAFMNMLKMEDNQKYRLTIKNTIEFDPEILKRFVNFMNNPDEDTAVAQFGKDDKYFGVCAMMVTMPGLPMFGHGQIEGFTEKYGMEYRRAYWNETPDQSLIDRHRREIFPIIKRRYIFSGVENYLLYDFYSPEGWVNENVFAYSNRMGMDRGLVLYNNKFEDAKGWIKTSASFAIKAGSDDKRLTQKILGEGLCLHNNGSYYTIFRDYISGLEYIRNSKELWDVGLYAELRAFKYHVFMDFREVQDNEYSHYYQLTQRLEGRGVPSVEDELKEIFMRPIYEKLHEIMNMDYFNKLVSKIKKSELPILLQEMAAKITGFLNAIKEHTGSNTDISPLTQSLTSYFETLLKLDEIDSLFKDSLSDQVKKAIKYFKLSFEDFPASYYRFFGWILFHSTGAILDEENSIELSRGWMDQWLFARKIYRIFQDLEMPEELSYQSIEIIRIMISKQDLYKEFHTKQKSKELVEAILSDSDINRFLKINHYNGVLWFNKEAFVILVQWLFNLSFIQLVHYANRDGKLIQKEIEELYDFTSKLLKAMEKSDFQIPKLLSALETKSGNDVKSKKSRDK
ncbi:MAG: alpha-amylase [Spirochaetales bacterium]|nr:alpha-amylase [Spirochaetales bacterium]